MATKKKNTSGNAGIELEIKKLRQELELLKESSTNSIEYLNDEFHTVLKQYGAFRIFITDFRDFFEAMGKKAEVTLGYTQKEVATMSSEEYREKILKPLGMGRKF